MRILVTGTTGFIGSHLAVHLARAGHDVLATARRPETLPALARVDGIRQERLDLAERDGWTDLMEGCQAVVHVALGWGDDGPAMLEGDTAATVALLEASRRAGVRRFVYTSSTAANGEMTPLNRADRAPRPTDLYGATKAATEMFARAYARDGMSVHVVRPGYIFGEPVLEGARSQPDGRFRDIASAVVAGNPVAVVRHDGTQFLHVADLAQVYSRLLHHDAPFSLHYALSSSWRSWEWVARQAMDIAGRTIPVHREERGYGVDPFLFDVSGIREDFDLDFDNGPRLADHLRWELERASSAT
jgi:UDP-glucose 4-epimerase